MSAALPVHASRDTAAGIEKAQAGASRLDAATAGVHDASETARPLPPILGQAPRHQGVANEPVSAQRKIPALRRAVKTLSGRARY